MLSGIAGAWTAIVNAMTPVVQALMPTWNDLVKAANDLWTTLVGLYNQFVDGLVNIGKELGITSDGVNTFGAAVKDVMTNYVGPGIKLVAQLFAFGIVSEFLNAVQAVIKAVTFLINLFEQGVAAAKAFFGASNNGGGTAGTAGSAGGDAGAAPLSRDGSSFTVGGSGGVDSQLIRVSPGEHVTGAGRQCKARWVQSTTICRAFATVVCSRLRI